MLVSNCCGAKIYIEELEICPKCLEHCYFENDGFEEIPVYEFEKCIEKP